MKRGGRLTGMAGFTIIEVLIVLAVSGALLVSAAALINGRQAKTEFQTGINNTQQQIQQIINETISGYYPNAGDFTCTGSSVGGVVSFHNASNRQGTNFGCIFMGKAIQFGLSATGDDASTLGVLPMVGNQNYNNGTIQDQAVQTLNKAAPRAVYPANSGDSAPVSSVASTLMQYGLSVATKNGMCGAGQGGICYAAGGNTYKTGIAAFLAGDSNGNIASADASGNGLASGSELFSLYAVSGSQPNESFADATAAIGNVATAGNGGMGNLVAASALYICIASGTTGQSGLFTIDGGSLTVKLDIRGDTTCGAG